MNKMKRILSIGGFVFFLLVTAIWIIPILWLFLSSFKTYPETVQLPVRILPNNFSNMENFKELFGTMNFLRYYRNNVIIAVSITVPQIILSAMAAYAFARLNFPLKNAIFMSLFIALMIPIQMILMPRYNLMLKLGLIDTYLAVIIPSIPSITHTFLLRQQILALPKSLDESAIIDGANHWIIFWLILLPLCKSAILAAGLMCLVFSWNMFLWPLIVINNPDWHNLAIATANLQGQVGTKENLIMTAALLVSFPVIVVFLITQKSFISGIAFTGIKG
jgi:multiple sugar transport system permease protein